MSKKVRIVNLNRDTGRYDLKNLPRKKTNRKSSSFVRRVPEKSLNYSESIPTTSTSAPVLDEYTPVEGCSSVTDFANPLDTLDAYKLEIVKADGFLVLSKTENKVIAAIPDYDSSLGIIKANAFHTVDCVFKSFVDGCFWVAVCTCSPRGQEFINALPFKVSQTFEEFKGHVAACIHAQATLDFLEKIQACNELILSSFQNVQGDHEYAVCFEIHELNDDVVCVNGGSYGFKNYGYIGIVQSKMACLSCPYNKHNCVHLKTIEDAISTSIQNVPPSVLSMVDRTKEGNSQMRSATGPLVRSSKPIPFVVPVNLQILFQTGLLQKCFLQPSSYVMIPPLIPGQVCSYCGSPWSSLDPLEMNWVDKSPKVFTSKTMFQCTVYFRKCSNSTCQGKLHVDGIEYGVLWIGKRMISYEVLRDFMHLYLHSGITLHSYFEVWEQRHIDCGNLSFRGFMDYNSWRFAWFAFLDLLEVDLREGWMCPTCGTMPNTVICDATSISFQKKFLTCNYFGGSGDILPQKSSHNQRVMIPNKEARKLLQKYCKDDSLDSMTKLRLQTLLGIYCPSLCSILHWIDREKAIHGGVHPNILSLLKSLSCNSPVCALLHPDEKLISIVSELASDDCSSVLADPKKMHTLQCGCPIVFHTISVLTSVAEPWKKLFEEMILKAKAPFNSATSPEMPVSCNPVLEEPSFSLAWFPSLPPIRKRASFACDQKKYEATAVCSKYSNGHPSLLPGIFTIFCQHGVCYGFEVMSCHESPNVPFSIIWTCFQKAPKVFIYDNACNFHQYSLNRDPDFFRGCWCLVDRFHWKNHNGCSDGYRLSSYPQFDSLNSQLNEQRNSSLKKLKSSLSYMNSQNFMNHVKFFLWNLNRKAISKLLSAASQMDTL